MSHSSCTLSHSHWITWTCDILQCHTHHAHCHTATECDILQCHTHHPHCHIATESLEHVTSCNVTLIMHIVTQPLNQSNVWHPTMSHSSSTLSHSHWITWTCDILQCHSHHPHCHIATESLEHVTSCNVTLIMHIVTQPLHQSNVWHPTMSHSSCTLSHSHWITRTCDILQ